MDSGDCLATEVGLWSTSLRKHFITALKGFAGLGAKDYAIIILLGVKV